VPAAPVVLQVDMESFLARERELVEQVHRLRHMNEVLAGHLDRGVANLHREVRRRGRARLAAVGIDR
jgi:hypothetical protein